MLEVNIETEDCQGPNPVRTGRIGQGSEGGKESGFWEDESNVVNIEMRAGGLSIHHCLTLHGSDVNRSGRPRRALVFQYRADDAFQLADGIWDLYSCNEIWKFPEKSEDHTSQIVHTDGTGGSTLSLPLAIWLHCGRAIHKYDLVWQLVCASPTYSHFKLPTE